MPNDRSNDPGGNVPGWLDLDGYCPPSVRDQLADATDRLAALLEPDSDFMTACRAAYDAAVSYEWVTAGCDIDDHAHIFGRWTGWTAFEHIAARVAAAAACAGGSPQTGFSSRHLPDWIGGRNGGNGGGGR